MVRIIILSLMLVGCASNDTPKLGKQVDAPWGWEYTYCQNHKDEIGCTIKSPN
jgi:hypothetical protein